MLDAIQEKTNDGFQHPAPSVFEESRRLTEARLSSTVWKRLFIAHYIYRFSVLLGLVLARAGATPNTLTFTSLALAAGAGFAAGISHFQVAAWIIIASGICDILDGVVARNANYVNPIAAELESRLGVGQ